MAKFPVNQGVVMSNYNFNKLGEFDHHRLFITLPDDNGNVIGFIAIHRGNGNSPAFGATRIWNYASEIDAIKDVLRLSKLMSYKAAMAGLPYGGAKAVLFNGIHNKRKREAYLKTYLQKVNYLRGSFITGADVGVNDNDLKVMAKNSTNIVGISSDPVKFTVLGVYYAIQTCLSEVFGSSTLRGRSIAIQGLGKTGYSLLKLVYKDAAKIYVCDIDKKKIELVQKEFPKVIIVSPEEIFTIEADIYSPCALGNVYTAKTIPNLKCKIIAGSANNQLAKGELGKMLYKSNILYAPDYVINAGGLIAVVEEYEHPKVSDKRIATKVLGIKKRLKAIIAQSKKSHEATNIIADQMAEQIFNKLT